LSRPAPIPRVSRGRVSTRTTRPRTRPRLRTLIGHPELGADGRKVLLVAHSAGTAVAMQYAIDHPAKVGGLVLEAPISPFGFGGTRDAEGTPCWPDFAGSGGL
jgi:pimeloyl-ACP methyl ester carboxylesterase